MPTSVPRPGRRRATAALTVLASAAALALPSATAHAAGPQRAGADAPSAPSGTPPTAYVDVAVATVWTGPDSPRPVDAPALTDPVHPDAWQRAMTGEQQKELVSEGLTQTQVQYGRPVYVLEKKDGWSKVAVPDQASPKNPLGYPGWIPDAQLTRNAHYGAVSAHRPFALVDKHLKTQLYDDPQLRSKNLRIGVNTRLPVLGRTGKAVRVDTPDQGPKWLSAGEVSLHRRESDIPRPSGDDLVRFAKKFLGLPYLWGGRSGFGVDCSGLTSTVYQAQGIELPRDADAQALHAGGRKVAKDDLAPGDLLFYAHDSGTGAIYHVALYVGDDKMIEAHDLKPARISRARFDADYWGAMRYLP
ncbi:C40 family peptidase [Streptomyces cacaoi]|uniref:C40 family peptidase n=1 Tax=Streptomyces cacaoi TaxID=1898 RepID=UPI0026066367|nr:C40 family peptidase [Streptomyces cacaoi]